MVKCTVQAQQAFNSLVQNRLSGTPSEPFIIVAIAIWYEGFVPDITQLTEFEEIARAGVDWHPNRSTHLRRNGST